jgi:hypothetical protein
VNLSKTTKQVGASDDYEFVSAHMWIIQRCEIVNMVALGIYHWVQDNAHCLQIWIHILMSTKVNITLDNTGEKSQETMGKDALVINIVI